MCRLIIIFNVLILCQLANAQALDAGIIGVDQTLCYSSVPATLNCTPSGGIPPYTYRWERSNDGTTWSIISLRTNQSSYSPPVLIASARFRVRVTDANSNMDYSNIVTITILQNVSAGTIGDPQSVCYGSSPMELVQKSAATGGSGIKTYQWQRSSDGIRWNNIPGAVLAGLIPPSLTTDTWFRRLALDETCGTTASNAVKMALYSQVTNIAVDSIYRSETPPSPQANARYELGTVFDVLSNGFISKAKLFSDIQETGEHIIRLWLIENGDTVLVAGPFSWNLPVGIDGWREFKFPEQIYVAPGRYIVSISNGPDRLYKQSTQNFTVPANRGTYIKYIKGVYTSKLGTAPGLDWNGCSYFRDVVFEIDNNGNLAPGSAGESQIVCYNFVPSPLVEKKAPSGGTGEYTFQWQKSMDGLSWNNITGANSAAYSPNNSTESAYYRRAVKSGSYCTVYTTPVHISVLSEQHIQAQLHDDRTIYNNTSTNWNIIITGGVEPFTIGYTLNGDDQPPIRNYLSSTSLSTGVLSDGQYTITLTSVNDKYGCPAQSTGNPITITVLEESPPSGPYTNKALVIVNSESASYLDYQNYVKPYLDNFGIPYDIYNSPTPNGLPNLTYYGIIILGHKNVYDGITTLYPISNLQDAISSGVGLYSFDPHLFDFPSGFNTLFQSPVTLTANSIDIVNTEHYITELHDPDLPYAYDRDIVNLLNPWMITQRSNLVNGVSLAQMTNFNTVTLLEVSSFGTGRIVKWSGYDWVYETHLGPVYGMDDLIWRGIVWAARKPFAIQGLPPMVTMRVDDVNGFGPMSNFRWIDVCNEFGIIPWCGLMIDEINQDHLPKLKSLIDNGLMTASPHTFYEDSGTGQGFIFMNHGNLPDFNVTSKTLEAGSFFTENNLTMSKYIIPHYYEMSSEALPVIQSLGVEFLGLIMPTNTFYQNQTVPWLNCGPYRIARNGDLKLPSNRPFYNGANVTLNHGGNNYTFFNCVTEIRDIEDYDWYVTDDPIYTAANGISYLRRAINSMVLPTLFTHYYYFNDIPEQDWRETLSIVKSVIDNEYSPLYLSMDDAIAYIRARNNIRITNVYEDLSNVFIEYSGSNDMPTKCFLFSETNGQILQRLISLEQLSGNSATVSVSKNN